MKREDFQIGDSPSGAKFDATRRYRHLLWRRWCLGGCGLDTMVAFCGLNPSTADENTDDPTMRRCTSFAKQWGFDGFVMLNLFALRATDPKVMMVDPDPVGELNNGAIVEISKSVPMVVCAWGVNGVHLFRDCEVITALKDTASGKVHHLGLTADGMPRHPLYLRGDVRPVHWF